MTCIVDSMLSESMVLLIPKKTLGHELHRCSILMVVPSVAFRRCGEPRRPVRGLGVYRSGAGEFDFDLNLCDTRKIGEIMLVERNACLGVDLASEVGTAVVVRSSAQGGDRNDRSFGRISSQRGL